MSPPDADRESLERRLDAVERALSADEAVDRTDELAELEARIAELEAAVEALRGYVGSVRSVNEDVERRADRALRKAEAIEQTVATGQREWEEPTQPGGPSDDDDETPLLERLRP
jgi:protein subunit release factor A